MFTGIIESVGTVASMTPKGGDTRLCVKVGKLDMSDVQLGDSIAVNGVCLTAIEFDDAHFCTDVSAETLRLTTLGGLSNGAQVNLEKALTMSTRLGGHLVSGHVDGVGTVRSKREDARSFLFKIEAPKIIAKYIAKKGSITVDGTSLTVNEVYDNVFDLNIVPHTMDETIISSYEKGSQVNLEVDIIARYLERMIQSEQTQGINEEMLARAGFVRA